MRNLAGLVDSPPLTWDTAKQNASFNIPYCDRFQKEYSRLRDECYLRFHRKGLSYLFGHNFVNMFPDLDDIIKNGSIPFEHLKDYILGNGLNVNEGYIEKPASQSDLERYSYVENPDIITENSRVIGTNSSPTASSSAFIKKRAAAVNVFAEIIEEISKEIGIELSVTTLPNISARLLKHYSSKFLEQTLVVSHSSSLPVSIRLFSLTARLVINELTIKLAARLLTFVASSANILFTITMITVIPDIVLSYYNIGGLNNELTREQLDIYRKSSLDNLLKTNLTQYDDMLNYIIIDNGNYISPIITPEFIYYLCIINFLKYNPEKAIDICHNGLGTEEDREEISQEYLKFLKVNSIGQNINYTNDKDDDEEFINYTLTTAQELSNNNNDKIK